MLYQWDTGTPINLNNWWRIGGFFWQATNDPCPDGWRVPTREQFLSLTNSGFVLGTLNGIGGALFGTAPNQIFLPAAGLWEPVRDEEPWAVGFIGRYWSRTYNSNVESWLLSFRAYGLGVVPSHRSIGYSVRCVEAAIAVESITLNQSAITLTSSGTSVWLSATVLPATAAQYIRWRSSNNAIATVIPSGDEANVVALVTEGTAIITATAPCGYTATATVTVEVNTFSDISNSLDGVVIDGVRWATRNVDMPGTFAANPEDAGMFYQWNRPVGWSSTNPMIDSNGGTVWDWSVPTGTAWYAENDPCPDGWRVPTQGELYSLINSGSVFGVLNGRGGRLFGTAPNQIFLLATAQRIEVSINDSVAPGLNGSYWSSTQNSSTEARILQFGSRADAAHSMRSSRRITGLPVRCVQE